MEGKSLSALRVCLVVCLLALFSRSLLAQEAAPRLYHWVSDPALFLESNKFAVVKELDAKPLWLQVGFGRPLLSWTHNDSVMTRQIYVGLEGLAWSRLQVLTDFRFPVETVDYFFGGYIRWDATFRKPIFYSQIPGISSRLRISHISSHDVDGKSVVVGGSSSHFSREFVEWMFQIPFTHPSLVYSIGPRWYFHQVTKIETALAMPASLSWRTFGGESNSVYVFVSTAAGPMWPTSAGGIRFERINSTPPFTSVTDIMIYGQDGCSWAGTDAGVWRTSINLQLDIRGL